MSRKFTSVREIKEQPCGNRTRVVKCFLVECEKAKNKECEHFEKYARPSVEEMEKEPCGRSLTKCIVTFCEDQDNCDHHKELVSKQLCDILERDMGITPDPNGKNWWDKPSK